jgi:hypothetical protein
VVQHDADADAGRRVDVDGKDARALALQVEREVAAALLQQLVGKAVRDERMEALEVEQGLDVAAAGGIAVVDGGEVGAKGAAELGGSANAWRTSATPASTSVESFGPGVARPPRGGPLRIVA